MKKKEDTSSLLECIIFLQKIEPNSRAAEQLALSVLFSMFLIVIVVWNLLS